MSVACVFCEIVRGAELASVVWEDDLTMAFLDHRQFHPGHTLVIPRQHLCDVRELDHKTGAALMDSVARITRAVGLAFPNQGLGLGTPLGKRQTRRCRICTSTCTLGCLTIACCASIHPPQPYLTSPCVTRMWLRCAPTLLEVHRDSNNRWGYRYIAQKITHLALWTSVPRNVVTPMRSCHVA